MSTNGIYEDVEQLKLDVANLQLLVTTMQSQMIVLIPQELTANKDLNDLGEGRYIIPSTSISGSLLNKPANANTATGYIAVVKGGTAGQLMMYYFSCAKEGASYWQRSYYEEAWGDWNEINVFDSGWIDLPLSGDVAAFNTEQKPRYRRVGKQVFITGAIKNVSAFNTLIATLPTHYRPSKKIIISIPSTGTKFSRISVMTDGTMYYEQSNDNTVAAGNWHSVACNFNVD